MKKLIHAIVVGLLLGACAVTGTAFGPTPEAQIATGANATSAAAATGTALLKGGRITAAQAKSYSAILHAASDHLHAANKDLEACRAKTGSTSQTKPDPCAATVASDVGLAVSVIGDVQKALDSK